MPRGDQTGPEGQGPMTGRSAGYCAGNDAPGFAEAGLGYGRGGRRQGGRGQGRGFARGPRMGLGFNNRPRRGWGMGAYPGVPTPEEESATLQAQASWLKQQLDAITRRIDELSPKSE